MRTIVLRDKRETLHVETPLGIFNIEVGLHDNKGRRVECVSIVAPRYSGEKKILRRGNRLVECLKARN